MKTLLIAVIIIAVIVIIILIIGIVWMYFTWQMNKKIDRLFSEIENIKSYLVID